MQDDRFGLIVEAVHNPFSPPMLCGAVIALHAWSMQALLESLSSSCAAWALRRVHAFVRSG